ncbi:basic salivary proline-rich protein 4-like [Molothrus ater]|uniref:basic salivary proline-rich protein 4-like n=1 Tax=Molothrus ater TaxID=84834 RepID=UPI0017499FD9|nr:basic salivary proline-rich protein 4-like [Molothrus ater]
MAELPLPAGLSAGTFPAKLWRLVNSPRVRSVRWDSRAQGLLIDRCLLERELLSSGHAHRGRGHGPAPVPHTFRATQFRSFVRQLYRYGFRKVPGWVGSAAPGDAGAWLHYCNPCFRRDRPDLLLRIKRRSAANRQRPAAGREGRRHPPCGSQQLPGPRPLPDGRRGRGRFQPLPRERPPLPAGRPPSGFLLLHRERTLPDGRELRSPRPGRLQQPPGERPLLARRPPCGFHLLHRERPLPARREGPSRFQELYGERPPPAEREVLGIPPCHFLGLHGERPLPLGREGPRSRSQELYGEQLPPAEREVLGVQPCSFQQLHREQQPAAYDARASPGTSGPSAPAGSAACAAWTASSSAQNAPGEEEWPPADLGLAVEKMIREIRRSLSERSPSAQDNVGVAPDSSGGEPVNRAAAEEVSSGTESCRNSSQEPQEPDAI